MTDAITFQKRLHDLKITVLGVGAGGTTLLRHLATVSIGNIDILDYDTVDLSNLTTHTSLDEGDVGKKKIDAMRDNIRRKNADVKVRIFDYKIQSCDDIVEYIRESDFVIQAFDKPVGVSKRWLNQACVKLNTPYASIGQTDKNGRISLCVPGKTPCAECIGLPEDSHCAITLPRR